MKLDYVTGASTDCPLIRLYDFIAKEARQLLDYVAGLASGAGEQIDVHELSFVQSIDGCRLTLFRRSWDQAVVRVGPSSFACAFTPDTWEDVAGLIEPFTQGARGFQWLAGTPGEANLLFSKSGQS